MIKSITLVSMMAFSVLSVVISGSSDSFDFKSAWKAVTNDIQKGLPKSALTKVEEIYFMARKEHNKEQIIKAVLFKTRLVLETEELGLEQVITDLDKYVKESNSPTKQILQSFSAEIFQSYYQSQYYRIAGRTDLGSFVPTDIRTWAPNNYRDYIAAMYISSLEETDTKKVKTEDIKELLATTENIDYNLRPTLYDLLLDRGLNYFRQTGVQGIQPSFKFVLDDKKYLAPADEFQDIEIESKDAQSMLYKATLLYQEALKINENNPAAYVNYDIARLHFVRQHGKIADMQTEFYNSILQSIENNKGSKFEYDYRMLKAQTHYEKGELEKAVSEYNDILSLDIDQNQKNSVANSLERIKMKSLSVSSEMVYTATENPLFQVRYRNLDKAYIKILELTQSDIANFRYGNNENKKPIFKNAKQVRAWSVDLSSTKKYSEASTETLTEDLPYGIYAIIVSNDESFNSSKHAYGYSLFHVSDMAYYTSTENDKNKFSVIDRESGKPLSKVEVDLYEQTYDRKSRKHIRNFLKTEITDLSGHVIFKGQSGKKIVPVLKRGKDILDLNNTLYFYISNQQRHEKGLTEIFTDRAIYRPGQTVHFKLIGMSLDKYRKPSIRTNESYSVKLLDANYQEVSTLEVVTNEYGSASGTFTLPTGLLTGRFTISTSHGQKQIQVEEYKRPKFEVKLDEITTKIALGDSIKVKGIATALSGSAVSGGKLTYTVTRYTYYGWWSWYRRSASSSTQIKSDELLTNGDGSFEFDFEAVADANMDISKNPTYSYEVKVDVTDIAGETRSTTQRVSVAALPYNLSLDIPTIVESEDLKKIKINAKNTNGQGVKATVVLVLRELNQPNEWQKDRYWSVPTDAVERKGDFTNKLGRINPIQSSGLDTYEEGKVVIEKELEIGKEGVEFDVSKYAVAGKSYQLLVQSKEVYGADIHIQTKSRFAVKDGQKGKLPPLKLLYTSGFEVAHEVGKPVNITLGTPDKELEVYYYIVRDWEILKEGYLTVKDKTVLSYTPVAADKGGISVQFIYGKHNRLMKESHNILLPWTEKQLTVELITKRDKVLPGSKEQWQVKLSGPKADKAAAEMVATMYDASLDQFKPHGYTFNSYSAHYGNIQLREFGYGLGQAGALNWNWNQVQYKDVFSKVSPRLLGIEYYGRNMYRQKRMMSRAGGMPSPEAEMMDEVQVTSMPMKNMDSVAASSSGVTNDGDVSVRGSRSDETAYYVDGVWIEGKESETTPPKVAPRTNLEETVFFYPHLETDKEGNILINFTMNEALTRWKLLTFAHDKDLRYGMTSHEVKTQKELMVVPNVPRFLREGDKLIFPTTISNLTDKEMEVNAALQLVDGLDGRDVNSEFNVKGQSNSITIKPGESTRVEWTVNVPKDYKSLVKYTVTAWTDGHTDGEESLLPVVTNQMLVTETEVLSVRKFETKQFVIKALDNKSKTAIPHALTLEYTSNPVWYAVQALPYIMEPGRKSTVRLFNIFYGNILATHIANANPRLQEIFEVWKATDSDALLSNLEKNKELKYAILEESPWVRDAQDETEQKKRIALLFDLNKMSAATSSALKELKERQSADGGFSWYTGGRSDEFTTQTVVAGIAHLEHLGVLTTEASYGDMIDRALEYLDEKILKRYRDIKNKKGDHLHQSAINYLYIRSFYEQKPFLKGTEAAYDYYMKQAEQYWLGKGLYLEAIIGLVLHRKGNKVANDIKASLTERSFYTEELGRYWNMGSSYMWYELPIESHAKLIEFFTEVNTDETFVEDMKIWLLKNKQTNRWKTTKATADAIYALLLQGEDGSMISWIEETSSPDINIGKKKIDTSTGNLEAGTGYIKKRYSADEIENGMDKVTIKNNSETIGWGATYYQYFEDLDKIKGHQDNPLEMTKTLYKEESTDYGPSLVALDENGRLEIGDRVISRVTIKVDRNMSYVHLKDMRPSGLEPENVISQYKWQDGIGYYESTRDLATNFFISHLRKGTYVFEYPMRVIHKGDFSTGIATLQCMYAPEFTSHSEGVRIVVD